MAFNLENMSVDYKKLLNVVPTQRTQLAQSGAINDVLSSLTPGQLANLFPRYYRDQLPDLGQINKYTASLDVALSGGGPTKYSTSPKAGSYTPTFAETNYTKTLTPEEKAIQELMEKAGIGKETGSGATSAVADNNGRIISTASTNISPQERALLDTIAIGNASKEGFWESPDYNTIVGGGKFDSFTDHPRIFGTSASTAAGRYQFTKTTWDEVLTRYNKKNPDNPITDFGPTNQDRAALFLARERYATNTGRDLDMDLSSPPPNMGELIRVGLGRGPKNLTWEAFVKKTDEEVQAAFESNYERNIGYVQEIEAAANQVQDLESIVQRFDPSMISQLEPRLQEYYKNATEIQKKNFEKALEKLGTDTFNETMKRQPLNTATLQAASLEGGPAMLPVGGSMAGKNITSDEDVPFSGGSYGSRSFGGPRGTNQLHTGVDIPGTLGDPVLAVDNGKIIDMRKSSSGYGYTLDIQYPDGTIHRMAHLGTNEGGEEGAFAEGLKIGDTVAAGQRIGTLGYSGNAGAEFPHVHYEVIDPNYYNNYHGRPPGRISGRTDQSMNELESGRMDPREWYAKRQKEYIKQQEEKAKADAEAKAQASPTQAVTSEPTATPEQVQSTPVPPTPQSDAATNASPVAAAQANTVPALASGGTIPPGENIAGINTDTGKLEFVANDRERIRVEPGELESTQQIPTPQSAAENVSEMESSKPPQQQRATQTVPESLPDPQMFENMVVGYSAVPPSQIRAANRAKLYGETSSNLVNGHFA